MCLTLKGAGILLSATFRHLGTADAFAASDVAPAGAALAAAAGAEELGACVASKYEESNKQQGTHNTASNRLPMIALSEDHWKVFELIAEEQPHPVVAPLRDIVAELTAMGLVATNSQGRWITTPQGDMLYRDRQDRPLH